MKPDLSLSNTDATWYLFQKYGEQTTSPVLPRVNIDSSDLTRAPQSIGLQRRSGIEVHTQSCLPSLRSLLPKSFRLHLDLRENDRQIDTHRNDFKSYGAQDNPLEAYERNKATFRFLESNTNDNLGIPIPKHNNRRYTTLQTNLEEQTQKIGKANFRRVKKLLLGISSISLKLRYLLKLL